MSRWFNAWLAELLPEWFTDKLAVLIVLTGVVMLWLWPL